MSAEFSSDGEANERVITPVKKPNYFLARGMAHESNSCEYCGRPAVRRECPPATFSAAVFGVISCRRGARETVLKRNVLGTVRWSCMYASLTF